MPDSIPVDQGGKLGLFPRTLVSTGKRNGVVIEARGNDVSVRWGDKQVGDVAGQTLRVTDGGIAVPDGWTADGHRLPPIEAAPTPTPAAPAAPKPKPKAPSRLGRGNLPAPTHTTGSPDAATTVQNSLFSEVDTLTGEILEAFGLDSPMKDLTKKELTTLLQDSVERAVKASAGRRLVLARTLAAQQPYRPGLLTEIVAILAVLAIEIGKALIKALQWLMKKENRDRMQLHAAASTLRVKALVRRMPEYRKLSRTLGITDDAAAGGVDDLLDQMTGIGK
jgi:hypothetical protein